MTSVECQMTNFISWHNLNGRISRMNVFDCTVNPDIASFQGPGKYVYYIPKSVI